MAMPPVSPEQIHSTRELFCQVPPDFTKVAYTFVRWVRQYLATDAYQEAQVSKRVTIHIYQWFQDVCSTQLLQTPINLGGRRLVVQINESLYCHKPKARNIKRTHYLSFHYLLNCNYIIFLQYHCGRAPQNEIWVLGW